MNPRSPAALYLALVPFGLMAGIAWSFTWTTGDTAMFLLGFAMMFVTPLVWATIFCTLERPHLLFALWAVACWGAILPGTWELEERFTDMRFEQQRPELEQEVARIGAMPLSVSQLGEVETTESLSPFGQAFALRDAEGPQVWFLRRRDRAFVYSPGAERFGPYTSRACRHLDGPWYDCDL